jgi:hypothetical protein
MKQLELGKTYTTQDSRRVTMMEVSAKYKGYETMADQYGHHRYNRSTQDSDNGRSTGTDHNYSHPGNIDWSVPPFEPTTEEMYEAKFTHSVIKRLNGRLHDLETLTREYVEHMSYAKGLRVKLDNILYSE